MIAPMIATIMLYRLKPVTPLAPKALKMKPPTIAPTIPRTMSRKRPSPDLLTILLAMKPSKIRNDTRAWGVDTAAVFLGLCFDQFPPDQP